MYYLIDLERSLLFGQIHYWKAAKRGYTKHVNEAGKFHLIVATDIVRSDFDNQTIKVHEDVVEKILKEC